MLWDLRAYDPVPAIIIVHKPEDIRFASYSYFANVYSLLISSMVSMLKSQLTQNDAIFVLVATVSPATLYIWATSAVALFKGLPKSIVLGIPNKREQGLLIILSFVSLALWATGVGVVAGLPNGVSFSQPGCELDYSSTQWTSLLWSVVFVGRSFVVVALLLGICHYLVRRTNKRGGTHPGAP
jgi:hypothetical protein